jgi:hypothetical protein
MYFEYSRSNCVKCNGSTSWVDFVMETHYISYEAGTEFMILFG